MVNIQRPVKITRPNNITPSAHTSIDGPIFLIFPSSTSGGIYRIEPASDPSIVKLVCKPAIPKSTILTLIYRIISYIFAIFFIEHNIL
jgi:hypothetical protein